MGCVDGQIRRDSGSGPIVGRALLVAIVIGGSVSIGIQLREGGYDGNSGEAGGRDDLRLASWRYEQPPAAIWIADASPMYMPRGVAEAAESRQGSGDPELLAPSALSDGQSRLHGRGIANEFYIRALICSYPWPCAEALEVAWCESRFEPNAVSPDGQNFGLFQVNLVHLGRVGGDRTSLLDAATNVRVAYAIWRDNAGWGPWACRP